MADVTLTREQAQGEGFPRICMQCGEEATEDVDRKYATDKVDMVPPPDAVGCLILGPILALLKLFSWSAAKTMTVRTLLCHRHARSWFAWTSLDASAITDETITVTGVSEKFIEQWKVKRKAMVEREALAVRVAGPVKIRCRTCQALNEESSKYCGQCGGVL